MILYSNSQTPTVTIYTYIVEKLYIVTILFLLRSISTKLLYGGWVRDISNREYYLPLLFSTTLRFFKTSEEFSRLTTKTSKSQSLMSFTSQHVCRDISQLVIEL